MRYNVRHERNRAVLVACRKVREVLGMDRSDRQRWLRTSALRRYQRSQSASHSLHPDERPDSGWGVRTACVRQPTLRSPRSSSCWGCLGKYERSVGETPAQRRNAPPRKTYRGPRSPNPKGLRADAQLSPRCRSTWRRVDYRSRCGQAEILGSCNVATYKRGQSINDVLPDVA